MTAKQQRDDVYDVVIVGAGPAALTCLSGIQETYSLDELSGLQLERAYGARRQQQKVAVIDPHNEWMYEWKQNFKALDIKYLRSPAIAHPDMFDTNALLAKAHALSTDNEKVPSDMLIESGCAEIRELLPLGQSQIGLWRLPSTELFLKFCKDLADRLPHEYICDKVTSIHHKDSIFLVKVAGQKQDLLSKSVILATGVVGKPLIPDGLKQAPNLVPWKDLDSILIPNEGRAPRKSILVVGGGLTAVQVAQKCFRQNHETTLCSRRHLVERHFDLPNMWFDRRFTNKCMSDFYHQPLDDRFKLLKEERGGGSVPPIYMKELRAMKGLNCLVTQHLQYKGKTTEGRYLVELMDGKCKEFDHIVIACGLQAQCDQHGLYSQILKDIPDVRGTLQGYPDLTEDLEWMDKLYVVGGMGGLNTGPDAANLMGMRRAAKVVVQSLGLRQWLRQDACANVYRNPFEAFADNSSDDESEASEEEVTHFISGEALEPLRKLQIVSSSRNPVVCSPRYIENLARA